MILAVSVSAVTYFLTIEYGRITVTSKSESGSGSEVAQLCPTLCDTMDCSLPGSSVHAIFQARVLEWVAIGLYVLSVLFGEGNGNLLQYSCLENPMEGRAW